MLTSEPSQEGVAGQHPECPATPMGPLDRYLAAACVLASAAGQIGAAYQLLNSQRRDPSIMQCIGGIQHLQQPSTCNLRS